MPVVVPFQRDILFGCSVGLDSGACVPRTSHAMVRMDHECLLVLSDAELSSWVLGSSALGPNLKRLSLYWNDALALCLATWSS